MRRLLPLVLCGPLLACDTGFAPVSLVEDLRVLGMRATPEIMRPGELSLLQALVVDPSRPGKSGTVLWLGCDPDPFNLNRSACSDPTVLTDPSALTGGTGMLPNGVKIIGFNSQAAYEAPKGTFDALPPGDLRREIGTVGQVLAFAVAEEVSPAATKDELKALFDRVQAKEVRSIISLFRIRISEGDERNADPAAKHLLVGGAPLPTGAHITVLPAEPLIIDVDVDPSAFEPYVQVSEAAREQKTERILVNWYSTMGRFSHDRTAVNEEVKTIFTGPGAKREDPVPESREGTLYTVLRDTRGGQWWQSYPMWVCDTASVAPRIDSIEVTAGAGEIRVHGDQLAGLLDVSFDDVGVSDGRVSADGSLWSAPRPPALKSGRLTAVTKSRACQIQRVPEVVVP